MILVASKTKRNSLLVHIRFGCINGMFIHFFSLLISLLHCCFDRSSVHFVRFGCYFFHPLVSWSFVHENVYNIEINLLWQKLISFLSCIYLWRCVSGFIVFFPLLYMQEASTLWITKSNESCDVRFLKTFNFCSIHFLFCFYLFFFCFFKFFCWGVF